MDVKELENVLETLDVFEERAGVRLSALSARLSVSDNYKYWEVLGEIHPREGTNLLHDIRICASVYDAAGRLINGSERRISAETFFGFETFDFSGNIHTTSISKIRVIPRIIERAYHRDIMQAPLSAKARPVPSRLSDIEQYIISNERENNE